MKISFINKSLKKFNLIVLIKLLLLDEISEIFQEIFIFHLEILGYIKSELHLLKILFI